MLVNPVKLWRLLHMRLAGAKVHPSIQMRSRLIFGSARNVHIGEHAWFEKDAVLVIGTTEDGKCGQVEIGDHFYCNRHTTINAFGRISIGSRVQVGPYCFIADFDHDLISRLDRPFHRPVAQVAPVVIHDEAWIGAHVVVLKGVSIGARSVVAAGAVVTADVPPETVVAGVPARPIKDLRPEYLHARGQHPMCSRRAAPESSE